MGKTGSVSKAHERSDTSFARESTQRGGGVHTFVILRGTLGLDREEAIGIGHEHHSGEAHARSLVDYLNAGAFLHV